MKNRFRRIRIVAVAVSMLVILICAGTVNAEITVNKLTHLTTDNPSYDTEPDWGPADSKIIYMRYSDDWWTNSAIYDMNADGTDKRELIPITSWHAKYNPDGTKIAYEAYKGTLALKDVNSGSVETLVPGENIYEGIRPSWSPDGRKIVYSRHCVGCPAEIWVYDLDARTNTKLTNENVGGYGEVYPTWSPDGTKIAYMRDFDIWLMNPDGSNKEDITNTPDIMEDPYSWSPDSSMIAYTCTYNNIPTGGNEICIVNRDGNNRVRLTDDLFNDQHPAWSHSGNKIVFESYRAGNGATDIWLMELEGINLSNSGNGTWQYSRDVTIKNPSNVLTDYQVLVNLTGISFPIEANTSGADIRFTDANGSELSYWIENWDFTNTSGQVWVNVTNVPSGVSSLRMWYGNLNATNKSNITETFIDGDDFMTNTSSNYQWADGDRSNNFYVSNGILYIEGGGATAHTLVPKVQNPPGSYIMEMYAQEDAKHLLGVTGFMDSLSDPTQAYSYYININSGDNFILSRADAGILPFVPISFSAKTWYYFLGRFSPSNISGKWNRAIDGTSTTDSTRTSGYYGITTHLANAQIDWWFVRKYASTEPYIVGYINGTVQNNSIGIAEAIVTTNINISTKTNASGFYSLALPSGDYHLTVVSEPRFYANNSVEVNAIAGSTTIQDIELLKKSTGNITGNVSG